MTTPAFPKPAADARTAVITGGGRGIGRACALELAQRGFRVALLSRSIEEIDDVAGFIHQHGGQATSAVCDVSDAESVERAVAMCTARLGPVDVLVNNAGQSHSVPFSRMALPDWQRMLDVNLTGTFLMTHAVLDAMVERKWGRIVNVASTAGLTGFRYTAHYCAAKHGVVGMTRALALETARSGVTVNAVCPGWVDTDMLSATVENISEKTGKVEEDARALLLQRIPTRRFVTPERVASLVAFLCSVEAGDVTGAALTMDGGETAGPP
jgi:3-hydroxybutyrate dehydrogenase